MGIITSSSGAILPEINSRHATAAKVIGPVRSKFFKNTDVPVEQKFHVRGALMLSRDCYGSGIWPILTTKERQRVHSNIIGGLRAAASERYTDHDDTMGATMFTDGHFLEVYNLRTPYAYIRFTRLRLSIRLAVRAPIEFLVLIYAARSD